MVRILLTLQSLLFAWGGALLFAQFQLVHPAPITAMIPVVTPVLVADGGVVTHHWLDGDHLFRKYDASGALLWTRAMEGELSTALLTGEPLMRMQADGSGGVVALHFVGAQRFTIPGLDLLDSVALSFQLIRIDADGELVSAVELTKRYRELYSMETTGYLSDLEVASTADGGLVVLSASRLSTEDTVEILRIGPDGTVLWCRSLGTYSGIMGSPYPTRETSTTRRRALRVTPAGHSVVMGGGVLPNAHLSLMELDDNGDLVRADRYVYGNSVQYVEFHDIAVDGLGRTHAAGSLLTSVGHFHVLLRITEQGQLDRADLYRTGSLFATGQLAIDGQGRRYHLVDRWDPMDGVAYMGLLVADTLGSPAHWLRRSDQVVPPDQVSLRTRRMDLVDDQLVMAGELRYVHMDLAYTTHYETISRIPAGPFESCLLGDSLLAHIPVPLDPVMTTEAILDRSSIDVGTFFSVQPLFVTLDPREADTLQVLCEFAAELVEGVTGLEEPPVGHGPALVGNTVVMRGLPLEIIATGIHTLDVVGLRGELVQRTGLAGSATVATSAIPAGVYLLRGYAHDGPAQLVQRVMVVE